MLDKNYVEKRIVMAKDDVELMDLYRLMTYKIDNDFRGKMALLETVAPAFIEKGFEGLLSEITYEYMNYTKEGFIERFSSVFEKIANDLSEGNIIRKYLNFIKWQKNPSMEKIQCLYDFADSKDLIGNPLFVRDIQGVLNKMPDFEGDQVHDFVYSYTKKYMTLMIQDPNSSALSQFLGLHLKAASNKNELTKGLAFVETLVNEHEEDINKRDICDLYAEWSEKLSEDSRDIEALKLSAQCLEKVYIYGDFGGQTKEQASVVSGLMQHYALIGNQGEELFWTKVFCETHFSTVGEENQIKILEHYAGCLEWAATQKTDLRMYSYGDYLKGFMELILENPNEIYLNKWVRSIMKLSKGMLDHDYIKLWARSIMELADANGEICRYLEMNISLLEERQENPVITLKKNM